MRFRISEDFCSGINESTDSLLKYDCLSLYSLSPFREFLYFFEESVWSLPFPK